MKKLILILLCLSIYFIGQAQVSKTVNVTTAGILSTLLTSTDKSTVTNLIVTGTIDARDFVTMRDSMPSLAMLDINAVNIANYKGINGTYTADTTFYSANEMPECSFYNPITNKGKTTLTSIILPSSLTSIGDAAFIGCTWLTTITIPSSVDSIGSFVFKGCTGLTSITIPNSVTTIGNSIFAGCTGLTTVTIGNSVTSLGNSSFFGCTGLTSITIPNSVTSIGSYAFYWCKNLTTITIPNSVITIGNSIFAGCTGLTTVTIGNSVTSLGNSSFFGCTGLTSITIPNSVTTIGDAAFYNCTGLTSITIPNSVTSIGTATFGFCELTSIIIGNSVTSIGEDAFEDCPRLTTIYSLNPVPPILVGNEWCPQDWSLTAVYVPASSIADYQVAPGWRDYFYSLIKAMSGTPISQIINNEEKVYATPSGIAVEGTSQGESVTLYSVNGIPLQSTISQGDQMVLPAKSGQIYLVKTQSKTFKVIY